MRTNREAHCVKELWIISCLKILPLSFLKINISRLINLFFLNSIR